ncbi:MAG: orotate phosphoribosyltransferase [Deltaproteobacteria bacterium]|nr:orotate phosphoribosyltransferase [Deltaproteobacteria bacterium]
MDMDYQIMDQTYKTNLLEVLYVRSFRYDPESGFTLTSGKKSDVYIDAKKTVLSAEGMELVGFAFFQELKHAPIDGVGGLTLGADPIACATALVSTMNGKSLDAFVIRKEPKKHGTMQWIEGNLQPGACVAIVDDVVTTGGSTILAVQRAREAGFEVKRVIALVDREEGGAENIMKETGCKFEALFTKSDFIELYNKHNKEKEDEKKKAEPREKPKQEKPFF